MRNSFEGGTDGANFVPASSGGVSGDAFSLLVLNNVSVPAGSSAAQYKAAAAFIGALGLRITPAASSSYVRWDVSASGTRFVMRRGFTVPVTTPTATAEICTMRTPTAAMSAVRVDTTRKPFFAVGTTDYNASKPASALTVGTKYFAELAVTLESVAGASDGVISFLITDQAGATVHSFSLTGQTTGTTAPTQYRYGGVTTATGWTQDDMDDVAANPLSSGWLGGPSNTPPNVTITGNQNVSAGATVLASVVATDDGSIASYAWSVVSASSTSTPTLTGASTSGVSFTAPAAGNLVTLQCVVTDNLGLTTTVATEVRVPVSGSFTTLALPGTGGWSNIGGAANSGAALADASDTTYEESPDYSISETELRQRLQPLTARSTLSLVPRSLVTSVGGTTKFRLYEGNTLRQEWPLTQNVSVADQTVTLTSPGSISDWGNLYAAWSAVS